MPTRNIVVLDNTHDTTVDFFEPLLNMNHIYPMTVTIID